MTRLLMAPMPDKPEYAHRTRALIEGLNPNATMKCTGRGLVQTGGSAAGTPPRQRPWMGLQRSRLNQTATRTRPKCCDQKSLRTPKNPDSAATHPKPTEYSGWDRSQPAYRYQISSSAIRPGCMSANAACRNGLDCRCEQTLPRPRS